MVIICNIESGLNVTVFIATYGAPWLQEYSLFKPGPLLRFSLVLQVYNGYLNSCPSGEPRLGACCLFLLGVFMLSNFNSKLIKISSVEVF